MTRRLALAGAVLLSLAAPARAQQEQTLADIRQQLAVLQVEVQSLRGQLNTTGAPGVGVGGGGSTLPDRVNAIESALQALTQATERLEFRIESVSRDGGTRIEDLRFQLCELTPDCDLGALPSPGPLGGASDGAAAAVTPVPAPSAGAGPELAVGEQGDFDRAQALLDGGDAAEAAAAFERFVTAYPTGPLSAEAQFLRGRALAADGQHPEAARAFLESFSGTPDGGRAPDSLVGLGTALGALGQRDEACLTLAEVAIRFPGSPAVAEAGSVQAGLGCAG